MLELNKIYLGDCLELMKEIEDGSIDLILTDLPYGTTDNEWDIEINYKLFFEIIFRILKNNSAFITTSRGILTAKLIYENQKYFRHKWVWNKKLQGNILNAKYMPLQIDEDILIFSNKTPVKYFPIMREGAKRKKWGSENRNFGMVGRNYTSINGYYYPVSILEIPNCINKIKNIHPTQKPLKLFEYLILTYSNENDTVLDCFSGSGTTAIACYNLKRNFICIEKDKDYYEKSVKRLENVKAQERIF
jgi:site-specific DNA-methyltransferase (adenine-specific)